MNNMIVKFNKLITLKLWFLKKATWQTENDMDFEFLFGNCLLLRKDVQKMKIIRKLKRTIKLTCAGALRQPYFIIWPYYNYNTIKHRQHMQVKWLGMDNLKTNLCVHTTLCWFISSFLLALTLKDDANGVHVATERRVLCCCLRYDWLRWDDALIVVFRMLIAPGIWRWRHTLQLAMLMTAPVDNWIRKL